MYIWDISCSYKCVAVYLGGHRFLRVAGQWGQGGKDRVITVEMMDLGDWSCLLISQICAFVFIVVSFPPSKAEAKEHAGLGFSLSENIAHAQ